MTDIDNTLQITAYSLESSAPIADNQDALGMAEAVGFGTYWPGGLYADASLYVPRDVLNYWGVKGAQRVIFRNNQEIVYEGNLDALDSQVDADREGITLNATGAWGYHLMRRRLRRYYCDKRVSDDAWVEDSSPATKELCTVQRQDDAGDVLLFIPQGKPWGAGWAIGVTYTAPAGEFIKQVTFSHDLTSNGEDWDLDLYDMTGGGAGTKVVDIATRTTAGSTTGTTTYNAGSAAVSKVRIYLISTGAITPAGGSYAEISNLKVYGWTGNSGNLANNMDEIAKDLVAKFTNIFNSDVTQIVTPGSGLDIEPFTSDWDTVADILTKAAGYGDGATPPNAYAFSMLHSEKAATPNGLGVLQLVQYPALTAYDYGAHLTDPNVVAPVSIRRNYETIANYCIVQYTNAQGKPAWMTPEDDANLKDATSITAYGQRDIVLNYGFANSTTATNLAKRHLARWKDPQVTLESPLSVQGYIQDNNGQPVPACRIQAGKRLRILDYLDDLSGTGLTVYVTQTSYNAESEICALTAGPLSPTFGVERNQLRPFRVITAGPPIKPKVEAPKKKKR